VRSKRTGALQLTSGGLRPMRTQLVIADGHLVFAESEADTGRVLRKLVERGLLTANEAQRLERRVLEVGGWSGMVKATELAVAEAHVAPNAALEAISEVVRERVAAALRVPDGEWVYRDDPRAASVPRYAVPFEKTVLEAFAHPDCCASFEVALERYHQHYPRLEGDSHENTTLFGLTPARFRTMRLLDGAHTLAEVLTQSPMGPSEAAALVAGLTVFERIWWNASPEPRRASGAMAAAPSPRALTIERPPPAIEALRALERPAPTSASPGERAPQRAPSQIRMPTPAPSEGRPASAPVAVNAALVNELLRRGGGRAVAPTTAHPHPPHAPQDTLSARGHFDRGRTHLRAGRIGPAHTDFARALELEPNDRDFLVHLRFTDYLQAADAAARGALEKELTQLATTRTREAESDPFAYHVLGRLAFDQGDDERARRAFKHAERLAPNDVETLRYLRLLAARHKK
jgi:tetratricopeptide (TPR) repeat protein